MTVFGIVFGLVAVILGILDGSLISLRWRWYHIVLMSAGVVFFASEIFFQRIGS